MRDDNDLLVAGELPADPADGGTPMPPPASKRTSARGLKVIKGGGGVEGYPEDFRASPDPGRVILRTHGKGVAVILQILTEDADWRGAIAHDTFADATVLLRQPPQREGEAFAIAPGTPWSDNDTVRTAAWIHQTYGLEVATTAVDEAVRVVAQANGFHPVALYLDALVWDGVPRVDRFFSVYCGAPDTTYARGVAKMLLLSAVARVRRPGCKVDTIVVFEGPQGGLKSSGIKALAGDDWYADTDLDLTSKDRFECLRGVWIYEMSELAAFKGKDAAKIKSFASSSVDNYRRSYARRAGKVPRGGIFVGTTNEEKYFDDHTGNRRYWPQPVGAIDLEAIRRDRDQLWAEAQARFAGGEPWWPDFDLATTGKVEQAERVELDPWEEPVARWLEKPFRRRVDEAGRVHEDFLDPADGLRMEDVLSSAINVPMAQQQGRSVTRATSILKALGWESSNPIRKKGEPRSRRWYRKPDPVPVSPPPRDPVPPPSPTSAAETDPGTASNGTPCPHPVPGARAT